MVNNEKGVTLIELIIVIALIGLIATVVGSMFFTGIRSFNTADEQIESYSNGRGAFMNIERQIKSSEEIFVEVGDENNRIYLQQMEDSRNYNELYNYYTLNTSTQRIMKHQVEKKKWGKVINGGTSQFADNIKSFQIEKKGDKVLELTIISEVKGKKLELNSQIRTGVDITNITPK